MKPQDSDDNERQLRATLRKWNVKATLPPRFQEDVWRRIAHAESQVPAWRLLLARLAAAIAKPSLAASYVTVLLLTGVISGYWQARLANTHADQMLSARYVQLVDPYQMPNH
jgi:hypothetical protein